MAHDPIEQPESEPAPTRNRFRSKQLPTLDGSGLIIVGVAACIFYLIVEKILHSGETLTIVLTIGVILLFSSFTQYLINKINRSQIELKRINDTLELKVEERTVDLQKTNVLLREEISIREDTEKKLRESELTYRTIFENTGTATIIVDAQAGIILANSGFLGLSGYRRDEIENRLSWLDLLDDKGKNKVQNSLEDFSLNPSAHPEHFECKFLNRVKKPLDVLVTFAAIPETKDFVASLADITELKEAERQIYRQAFHDSLTSLPNRALFMEHLIMALKRSKRRDGYASALLYLDIDRFKLVNDSLGHTVGDKLLVAFSEKIKLCLREEDTVSRLGGDEFAILLEDVGDSNYATLVAERIQQTLQEPFKLGDHEVFAPASFGIVLNIGDYDQPEDVIRDADSAMYHAKEMGKAQFKIFDRTLHEKALNLLQLETDLRKAIEKNEFEVYYQPIVSVGSHSILGFEALIRWNHPQQGVVMPDSFIPVAEETGLIIPIGRWVMQQACTDLKRWRDEIGLDQDFFISVNISGRQFSHPNLVADIQTILWETKLPPELLKLEVTETVLMKDAELAIHSLERLRQIGVRIVMDDFGTGYSSLSHLQRLPIDTLKVDKGFVSRVNEHPSDNKNIVEAIVSLAHKLNLIVVAEGVETEIQHSFLSTLNCQLAQGYLFARPLSQAKSEELVRRLTQMSHDGTLSQFRLRALLPEDD